MKKVREFKSKNGSMYIRIETNDSSGDKETTINVEQSSSIIDKSMLVTIGYLSASAFLLYLAFSVLGH